MIEMSAYSTEKGPITDGRAMRALLDYEQDVEKVLARRGAALVVSFSKASFKNVTPYYWYQIHEEPAGAGWEVTDGGVIYGPWLEGVGSRNATTRFKGYGMYRRASQALNQQAVMIAEGHLRLYLPRMQ
jgi:hypothetical protein